MSARFVISDLHMGDGGPRDKFELNPKREDDLLRFCDYVDDQQGLLRLLGDIWELWQMNPSDVLRRRLRVVQRFMCMLRDSVPGNHDIDITDPAIAPIFGLYPPIPWPDGIEIYKFKKIRFFHGHEVDPFNNTRNPGWGRVMAIAAGLYEDHNKSPVLPDGSLIEERLLKIGNRIGMLANLASYSYHWIKDDAPPVVDFSVGLRPVQSATRLGQHLVAVAADIKSRGYDIAVCGHTHIRGHYGHPKPWYYNCGSWSWNEEPFLRIDDNDQVTEWIWTGRTAVQVSREITIGRRRSHE